MLQCKLPSTKFDQSTEELVEPLTISKISRWTLEFDILWTYNMQNFNTILKLTCYCVQHSAPYDTSCVEPREQVLLTTETVQVTDVTSGNINRTCFTLFNTQWFSSPTHHSCMTRMNDFDSETFVIYMGTR